ncbi:MAG: type I 3-dehydroquinate dehydratase [Chitinispirillales bacterium]|jgi:3-dehydroquinate dehydratase-1|nr:type I 3-dehydroquinate dehydratase [Chitinispirillales bacterium]
MRIKNLELGSIPRVVGIIDSFISQTRLRALQDSGIDIFEVRVDLLNKPIDKIINYIKEISSPLIGTIRETDFNRGNRAELFRAAAPYVDCVDIELGTPRWREITDAAESGGSVIMVSEHDFERTPGIEGLNDIVKRSLDQGAQIVKIAVMAKDVSDVTRLLRFTENCETPLVTIAMGDIGTVSRVIAPLFGSLFTYGYLKKPLAPGQLPALRLVRELNNYFPKRRAETFLSRDGLK